MTVSVPTAFMADRPVRVEVGEVAVEIRVQGGVTFLIVEVPPDLSDKVVIRQVDRCPTNSN